MAVVVLSWQQPYTDRLQCWGAVSSGRDVAEIADEVGRKKGGGRWEMAQRETEEHQHLSDYGGEGFGGWGEELDNTISEQHVTFCQQ